MNLYDLVYGFGITVSAPIWLVRQRSRTKVLRALRERMGRVTPWHADGPLVMVHAVSLGEMNATRELIRGLSAQRPGMRFLVTSTTDTGYARGRELYHDSPSVRVERFPLDFTAAIDRLLDAYRPAAVVLMELEVWPNFMRHCNMRGIPVAVVNGRLTEGSYRSYLRAGLLTRPMFARLACVCAQEEVYADRFRNLGVPADRVQITGTMKFDTAQVADAIPGAEELATSVGLKPSDVVWVCGSTGPGEEAMVLACWKALRQQFPSLRLVIVPRHPQRFDEVAQLITSQGHRLLRRSRPGEVTGTGDGDPVILGDTMGELRKFYSLGSVVFVGRSLVDLGGKQHGSDMIEPAALAKPTIVGPFTTNFADVMSCFRRANAMVEVQGEPDLRDQVLRLLEDPAESRRLGNAAREVVVAGKGATSRNVAKLIALLPTSVAKVS